MSKFILFLRVLIMYSLSIKDIIIIRRNICLLLTSPGKSISHFIFIGQANTIEISYKRKIFKPLLWAVINEYSDCL
jgi:hypothetical protein